MKNFKKLLGKMSEDRKERIRQRFEELVTEYEKFLARQSDEFKAEILKDLNNPTEKFIDQNFKPITLEELKDLDKKYNDSDQ